MRSESENGLNGWIAEHANRMTENRRESVAINKIGMFEMKRKERKRRKGRDRRHNAQRQNRTNGIVMVMMILIWLVYFGMIVDGFMVSNSNSKLFVTRSG